VLNHPEKKKRESIVSGDFDETGFQPSSLKTEANRNRPRGDLAAHGPRAVRKEKNRVQSKKEKGICQKERRQKVLGEGQLQ